MMRILRAAFSAAAMLSAAQAMAADDIAIAFTPNSESAPVFVGLEEGIFAKHGLNASIVPVPVNSALPAAIMSGSVTIATFTPTTFLQASANGVELQAIAGMTVTDQNATRVGIVTSPASGVTAPEMLAGKTIGVPGIGAVLDVMTRRVLMEKKVDLSNIRFIETTFPTQADQLQTGVLDAVVSLDPFISRMEGAGVGKLVTNLLDGVEDGQAAQFFGASSSWVEENPQAVKNFRAAIAEADAFIKRDPAAARAAIGKYLKLPPEVLEHIALPATNPAITSKQLDWWVAVMSQQGLIPADTGTASLIAK